MRWRRRSQRQHDHVTSQQLRTKIDPMKKAFVLGTVFLTGIAMLPLSVLADTYSDSINENFTAAGGGILDISSVEVNNSATLLSFKINLTGNPSTTDWGKYMISLNTTSGGDSAGNGWGRPINMSG